jgi:hypothetical protein
MTNKYSPIIEELQRAEISLTELWGPLGMRQVRVSRHRPGTAKPEDITDAYADAIRKSADALLKAIAVLKNPP